ncbi:bacterio-opsin activator domain-containing protein [Haloarchaeobius salinus]|uniref:bacterio-opsin activator domain-containing protein n=1 Tax=Haloarchaeobius salinus TaxID=1198298 RepID=UPI00210B7B94|nr:bacterio-opsin activator domain-containing protein [Haloarchaeobius salinus]
MGRPLTDAGYDRLRRHAESHREDLVCRLCAEAGLRPAEVTQVTPDSVVAVDDAFLLDLPDRTAFLPADVAHDLRLYADATDCAPDEPVVDVSPRRVQMLVREVADRAADVTGEARFADVSSRDLREQFVLRHLQAGVDPRVVAAAAGFEGVAGLAPYLDEPSGVELAAALSGGDGHDDDELSARSRAAVDLLATLAGDLGAVTTTEELYARLCDRVVSVAGYESAWVARATDDGLERRAHAGFDGAVVDTLLADYADDLDAVLRSGTHRVLDLAGDDVAVCLPFGATEGADRVLGVGVAGPVADAETDALVALGGLAGRALDALRRRRRLVADVVTELRFTVRDSDAVVVDLSTGPADRVEVTGVVPGGPGLVLYAVVAGATPDAVSDSLADDERVERVRYVDDTVDGPVVELALSNSPASRLVEFDARVESYVAEDGVGSLVATVATDADVRAVVDGLTERYPDSGLGAKETVERTVDPGAGFSASLRDDLTERQAAVLRAAYHGGYFQWPRESTAEELADSLDVASPTLHNHLRVAQAKLLDAYFEG